MEDIAQVAIDHAMKLGAEFVDLRMESARGTNIVVMDGRTKTLNALTEAGCGLRAFVGGAWGFAATNTLNAFSAKAAAASATKMAKAAQAKAKVKFKIRHAPAVRVREEYACKERPSDVSTEAKLRYVLGQDKMMRDLDPRISSTNTRYDDIEADRIVANSFGTMSRTREIWLISACSAWSSSQGIVQRGHAACGSVGGYELMRGDEAQSIGEKATQMALRLLDSKPPSAGKFTCILDNKMTGLLAHEAFGHACEADGVLAGASVLEGKVGKKVAQREVSLIDDPTIRNTFGYFSIDWEGVKSRKHVLIEDGVLKGYMHNLETSSRMGLPPNGSARAQAYNSPPIIRMSNTYIGPGDWKKEELFEDLKYGLLIQGGQYGYVEPAKGQFMFKCDEAYEIRNGEIGQRFRDASLSGVILDVLNNVDALGNDFVLGDPGYCGKGGQDARTTDGGPHLRVKNVVVGGLT
ncbi:MAG: TldD/PmbA family protein [Candidatus Thermoplasmatota archaeon]|nr:TldD/PmbA family protein [Candidatus Thermoplasmatota archaeon]